MCKKNKTRLYSLIPIVVGLLFFNGCTRNQTGTVTDIDGNIYHTIKLGSQVWMVENLKVTRYQNGDIIPNILDTMQWSYLPTGTFCNYSNDSKNTNTYGHLYNWFAATDSRNIAPKGWHVPAYKEIETLVAFLGGDTIASGKMKESGTKHWLAPNSGATNESGLAVLPGGYRFYRGGTFHTLGSNGYWWTTTQSVEFYAWSKRIFWYFAHADYNHDLKTFGFSIRCVKD